MKPKPLAQADAETSVDQRSAGGPFPIVGVGASAGGLEAFRELLAHLPPDTGMGFVLVQHLDPQHESALTDLLQRVTALPVHEVTSNQPVEPNHVYIIAPNTNLGISAGALTRSPRPQTRTATRSIDMFLEALAEDQHERAIGVILSGTATDGTLGLEAIKAEGGVTFAQDDSARYDSMPRSAVAAGCVDFVLSPKDIAKELARIAKHPSVSAGAGASAAEDPSTSLRASPSTPPEGEHHRTTTAHPGPSTSLRPGGGGEKAGAKGGNEGFKKTLLLLRNHCGVDFSLYKSSTIQRRITRRLVLNKKDTLDDYAQFLRGNTKELDALYSDVLISVTSFFRNPEAFEVLQQKVWPQLLRQKGEEPLRVWVLGCSTGQEAYSIAMGYVEAAAEAPRMRPLQVFATDLNDALLDKARHGLYAKSVAQDLSPERLRRFFAEEEGGYRVSKALREMVVFARQNVISDPPFSRMDLVSCRNLMIYFESDLQKKLFPVFHYALKPGGFLYLGSSESIGGFTDLFEPMDRKHQIYAKKSAPTPAFQLPARQARGQTPPPAARAAGDPFTQARQGGAIESFRAEITAQREADRVTVNQFAPPAVLINADLQVLQFRGHTSPYLAPPKGKATFDVLKMARPGLMLPLGAAINQSKKNSKTVRRERVRIEQNGESRTITLEVIPLRNVRERCFLIVFADTDGRRAPAAVQAPAPARRPRRGEDARKSAELEFELAETREYLQGVQEQNEAANEELQASNEEIQSANEELQSLNEELETSKEELESANEELTTLNEEMTNRNAELSRLNSDLVNIQTSAHQTLVLLSRNLAIRRFSAQAEKQFNLLAADVGRPIGNVRHNLDLPDLDALVTGVIDTVRAVEREVQDKEGRWFSLRVRPYLTLDNKVDGAVLVLVDIDALKRGEQAIAAARDYSDSIIETVREALLVLDADLRIERVNRSFCNAFGVTQAETVGQLIYDLGNRQWDIAALRSLLEEILFRNNSIEDYSVTHDFQRLGRRTMLLNARRMHGPNITADRILLAITDITERIRGEEARARLAAIVSSSDDAIVGKTVDGIIASWNEAAERMFGYTGAEAVGRHISLIVPVERRPEEDEVLLRVGRGEKVGSFETERRSKDGHTLSVSITVSPVRDAQGEIIGASEIARDITGRRLAEQGLRDSEERYRLLVEGATGFAIIMLDVEGRVKSWNTGAERLLGYADAEILGQHFSTLFRAEDQVKGMPQRELETARRKEVGPDDNWLRRKDGSEFWASGATSALRDEAGTLIGFTKVVRDITDRKHAEDALHLREADLRSQAEELMRFNQAAVGREVRMIELKKEVNELRERHGEPATYPLAFEQEGRDTDG